MESITGYIERITYQSEENGYTVARLKEPRKRELTVIVGTMPSVQPGETIKCYGEWKNNVQYGLQFDVKTYEVEVPSDVQGIKKYLGSGLIKGIGDVFAERIVDYFGTKTLDIIDQEPEKLTMVSGIGQGRLQKIKTCWGEQKFIREVMLFLQQYHVTPTFAQKIFKQYREESILKIQENPYQLAKDIFGIGFKTADSLAQKMGIARDGPERLDAGVEYALAELSNEGHTCHPVETFLESAAALLEVDKALISERLEGLEKEDRVVLETLALAEPVQCIWLKPFYMAELGIVKELARLAAHPSRIPNAKLPEAVDWAQKELNIELATAQRLAVEKALNNKMHVITGGPGTGKSTITNVILTIAKQKTEKITLAAPTGRAAKRLGSITGREALTLHSLLEFDFKIGGFRRNRENPLDTDFLIVDETSMVDTLLFYNLLKAIPDHAKLLLVGDVDQLPSVGPGNVLDDIIDSGQLSVTRLTEIFRQAASSKIITSAHAVNQGKWPDISNQKESDFFFLEQDNPESIAATICDLVASRLPTAYKLDSFEDVQVLCPMKIGVLGTGNLNDMLQKRLNPSNEPLVKMGRTFHVHDKVMQLRNNYDKGVYNGDIGIIQSIDRTDQEVMVLFDNKAVVYDYSELDELTLAYAASVHKYQGSECPCIVMPVHTAHYRLLFRNLLYTGITRGKRLVILVGSKKALWIAIQNNDALQRWTGLRQVMAEHFTLGKGGLGEPVVVKM